ncbi:MAG: hypothetical protein AAGK17_10090 [Pseudomonadota bacterium]
MVLFQELKLFIAETIGLEKDALHVYVALLVFMFACWVFRWRASSVKPWLIVLLAALMGEYFDIRTNRDAGREFDFDIHWRDLWNTMLAPTLLVIAARFTNIFERGDPSKPDEITSQEDDTAAS